MSPPQKTIYASIIFRVKGGYNAETNDMSRRYDPYDDSNQLERYIDRYPLSFKRTPLAPLVPRPLTLSELTGPAELDQRFQVGPMDLSRVTADAPRATGQLIQISGRVTDEDGSPIPGAVLEIWQANSAGKYIHDADRHPAPIGVHSSVR